MNGSYSGKRVLITQSSMVRIAGSEVQALELAEFLGNVGAEVTIYAWLCEEPMRKFLREKNIKYIDSTDRLANDLSFTNFDFIWIQHESIPINMLKELAELEKIHLEDKTIVFSHMSPFQEIYVEHPYHPGLEENLADAIVFNSSESLVAQREFYSLKIPQLLYQNPAPEEFTGLATHDGELKRILIVSNHAPREVTEAARILNDKSIVVDFLKDRVDNIEAQIISPQLLDQYDCVVSIGKTVQDCLVGGIPVYVYDYFGGPGYLNEENFETAEFFNFSGRMTKTSRALEEAKVMSKVNRRSEDLIVEDILSGFDSAFEYQTKNRTRFIEKFSISKAFSQVMKQAMDRPKRHYQCALDQFKWIVNLQQMIMQYHIAVVQGDKTHRLFYSQKVTVFESPGDVFSNADVIKQDVNLTQAMVVPIRVTNHLNFRIDYGEMPCFIQDLEVAGITTEQYTLSSDATISDGSSFVFPFNDPKVLLSLHGVDEGTDIEIRCKVKPFSKEMPRWVRDLLKQRTALDDRGRSDAQELCAIKESKWWKIGERLRRVIHKR